MHAPVYPADNGDLTLAIGTKQPATCNIKWVPDNNQASKY